MRAEVEIIQSAFPLEVRKNVDSLLAKFTIETKHSTKGAETVTIGNDAVKIPSRIYYNPPYALSDSKFTNAEREILSCIFSRHHHGFVRQKAIQNILASNSYWTTPYIVMAMGEYVVEILSDIDNNFEAIDRVNLISFIRQNPKFYSRTCSRISSYWGCYYRQQFPKKRNGIRVAKEERYVGFRLLDRIDKLVNDDR